MPVPEYYDDAGISIKVDPDTIFREATVAIPALGNEIADSVNRVVQVWNDLKIGWVGNTAQEAQDFNDRWVASISELFGSSADPSSGVLSRISNGVAMAAVNYGQSEDVVTNMFTQTAKALEQGGGTREGGTAPSGNDTPASSTGSVAHSSPSGDSPDHRAANGGPITENS